MTFLDAAIEILRDAKDPLHFSEIAKRAVSDKLLSHVGRDPEAAMQSCLNSAVRRGRESGEAIIVRAKPGYYSIRPGAILPDPPARPNAAEETPAAEAAEAAAEPSAGARAAKKSAKASRSRRSGGEGKGGKTRSRAKSDPADTGPPRKRNSRRAKGGEGDEATAPADASQAEASDRNEAGADAGGAPAPDGKAGPEAAPSASGATPGGRASVEFEAPSGSGLDGVTDVALVMANAMSRLVEERPELREELEAMQQNPSGTPTPTPPAASSSGTSVEERPSRRRRRRRRRGRRVEWSGAGSSSVRADAASMTEKLLDSVAEVLADAGAKSLHVRQIAETLASKNVLGGEISEIERAVTSSVLLDIHTSGRNSRFVARGDARYQLQGTRVPEPVAKAEQSLRDALAHLDRETSNQFERWLQSLGARALESLVRMYLQAEGYNLAATLPPSRGMGKLIVEDPDPEDDESRVLVLVVPRRTQLEPKLWEGEVERNNCGALLLFTTAEVPEDLGASELRVVGGAEFAAWLRRHGIGVQRVNLQVSMLDSVLIESVGGLDT